MSDLATGGSVLAPFGTLMLNLSVELAKARAENERLRGQVDFLQRNNDACVDDSEVIRLTKERDAWRSCAERLAKEDPDDTGFAEALAEFDRLAKGIQ